MVYLKNKFNNFASWLQDLSLGRCWRKYYKCNSASRVDTKIALIYKLINWTQFECSHPFVLSEYSDTSANEDFFAVFWTRLTGLTNVLVDAHANIKQQTLTVGPFQELIFSVCMCVTKNFQFHSIKCIIYFQYNSIKIVSFSSYFPFSFIQLGSCSSEPLVSFCLFIVCFLLFYKTYL